MKISSEQIANRQISLNIEMDSTEVDGFMTKAYGHLVGKIAVPGFRKGKTPRQVFERHVGKQRLLQEALEFLIPESYEKAIADEKIEAIAKPEIEITSIEPVIFKAIVPLKPEVLLGDYQSIRVEPKTVEIADKDVEATIVQLRNQNASQIPVEDRPADVGDIITMDIEGEGESGAFPARKNIGYEINKESQYPIPGFAEKIIGMNKDEERSFELTYPEDYQIKDLAGKKYLYKVKINEIKQKQLPELNDEFAKSVGSDTMVALKEQITNTLKTNAEQRSNTEFEQTIIDKIVELSTIDYPPVLIENEVTRILNEESRVFPEGLTGLQNYLASINKTWDAHKEELNPEAKRRIVGSLVLSKISEGENISVSPDEINTEIEKMVSDARENAEEMRSFFNMPQAQRSVEQFMITKKTVDLLKQIVIGKNEDPVTKETEEIK